MKQGFKLLIILVFLGIKGLSAQNQIALEHNGAVKLYFQMDSAILNAQNGDDIYISGGTFDLGTGLNINKSLRIYGVGHYPDSTLATSQTILNGNITFKTGADSGLMTGIFVNGNITFGSSAIDQTVKNYSINRCNINTINLSFDGMTSTSSQSLLVSENIIRTDILGGNAQGCLVEKNIIAGHTRYFNSAIFKNNIFLKQGIYCGGSCEDYPITNVVASTFENNIFRNSDVNYMWPSTFSGNTFNNNLFAITFTFPVGNLNQGNAFNKLNVPQDSIFVNQTGTIFNYTHNYHLKSNSVGYNSGTDGLDIGIFGSANPYKEGAVPVNPHIQSKSIGSQTNPNGSLSVKVKVAAQER